MLGPGATPNGPTLRHVKVPGASGKLLVSLAAGGPGKPTGATLDPSMGQSCLICVSLTSEAVTWGREKSYSGIRIVGRLR